MDAHPPRFFPYNLGINVIFQSRAMETEAGLLFDMGNLEAYFFRN
jgi:hypothetical protein